MASIIDRESPDPTYARVDRSGVIRCGALDRSGHRTCVVRFGKVLPGGHVGIDAGWTTREDDDEREIVLNAPNRQRYASFKERGNLANWRAAARKGDAKNTRPYRLADLAGTYVIVCPEHGPQVISHERLGTADWFEHEPDLGDEVWTPWPPS